MSKHFVIPDVEGLNGFGVPGLNDFVVNVNEDEDDEDGNEDEEELADAGSVFDRPSWHFDDLVRLPSGSPEQYLFLAMVYLTIGLSLSIIVLGGLFKFRVCLLSFIVFSGLCTPSRLGPTTRVEDFTLCDDYWEFFLFCWMVCRFAVKSISTFNPLLWFIVSSGWVFCLLVFAVGALFRRRCYAIWCTLLFLVVSGVFLLYQLYCCVTFVVFVEGFCVASFDLFVCYLVHSRYVV